MTSIDLEIERYHLPIPDFIKIDIEGMEAEAIRGMEHTISEHAPMLYLELHGSTRADKEANAREVIALLRERQYRIHDIEAGREIPKTEPGTGRESHIFAGRTGSSPNF